MAVIVDGVKKYKNRQQSFITLTVDGDECKLQPKVPAGLSGQTLQDHVNANERSYKNIILKHMYPESAGTPKNIYYGSLEGFEQWIADGVKIPAVLDEEENEITPETVAEKVEWKGTHPKVMITREEFDKLNITDKIKILADLLMDT